MMYAKLKSHLIFGFKQLFYVCLIQTIAIQLLAAHPTSDQKVQAADRTITGTVVDAATGEPLIGVNILVTGTTTGTATDQEGTFNLTIPDDAETLTVSYIGYVTKEVPLSSNNSEYHIQLQADNELLDELVVVAYGMQRESDITGSIASVDTEGFNK